VVNVGRYTIHGSYGNNLKEAGNTCREAFERRLALDAYIILFLFFLQLWSLLEVALFVRKKVTNVDQVF